MISHLNRLLPFTALDIIIIMFHYRYSNNTMPELVGVLAINDRLQRATKLDFAGKLVGAEAFAVDKNGKREYNSV